MQIEAVLRLYMYRKVLCQSPAQGFESHRRDSVVFWARGAETFPAQATVAIYCISDMLLKANIGHLLVRILVALQKMSG